MYMKADDSLGQHQTPRAAFLQASNDLLFQRVRRVILDAVRRGMVTVTMAQALHRGLSEGITDPNELTDRVFFVRHPERQGRRIERGEARYKQLSKEWQHIRNTLIQTVLAQGQAPALPVPAVPNVPQTTSLSSQLRALAEIRPLVKRAVTPSIPNALSIMKTLCNYHGIPWRLGYSVLQHEGGVRLFGHPDGVMQTIQGSRQDNIPKIARELRLTLLGLPLTDQASDEQLTKRLHEEFPRRLAIQIATGIQELSTGLKYFNGYLALALAAYNTGRGSVALAVTAGKSKHRPANVAPDHWENSCRVAASRYHQQPSSLRIDTGRWLCDPNLRSGKWLPRFGSRVYDTQSNVRLYGYQYLRRVKGCLPSQGPTSVCDWGIPKKQRVQAGSGSLICATTRYGVLDKFYDPQKLGAYYKVAQSSLSPIVDNKVPLKVLDGRVVEIKADGTAVEIPA